MYKLYFVYITVSTNHFPLTILLYFKNLQLKAQTLKQEEPVGFSILILIPLVWVGLKDITVSPQGPHGTLKWEQTKLSMLLFFPGTGVPRSRAPLSQRRISKGQKNHTQHAAPLPPPSSLIPENGYIPFQWQRDHLKIFCNSYLANLNPNITMFSTTVSHRERENLSPFRSWHNHRRT